jgi:outer membrane protein assembly factor BamA
VSGTGAPVRRMLLACAIVLALVALTADRSVAQTPGVETLGEVRVHGNHTTPDDVVLSLAGLTVGTPVTDEVLQQAEERLRKSGRFADVEVRKRFRSIDNPSDVLAIVLVDELTAVSSDDLTPGPMKRITSAGMWMPIVDYADGYGFTYGGRVSFVNALGSRSRISVPLTWGGERKAAVEVDRTFENGPFTRISGSLGITRRVNPYLDSPDTRREIAARAERALTPWLRAGGGVRVSYVDATIDDRYVIPGVDLTVDTRIDPAFPRNALHVTAGVEQMHFKYSPQALRWTSDARGYVGLIGSSVLALRVVTSQASEPLPLNERALLGGTQTLRGYDVGYRAADNLVALSAEVRVPLTSPVHVGRFGVKGFIDAGTVYGAQRKLSDQRFDRGIGGGVFFTATIIRAGLDVAWPSRSVNPFDDLYGKPDEFSNGPRWHFGLGVTF